MGEGEAEVNARNSPPTVELPPSGRDPENQNAEGQCNMTDKLFLKKTLATLGIYSDFLLFFLVLLLQTGDYWEYNNTINARRRMFAAGAAMFSLVYRVNCM